MILKEVYERFAEKTPVSVMVRATIENVLAADRLDELFEEHAEQQRPGELLFSTVLDIMGLVVCQIQPSVNAVYVDRKKEIGVTIKSVYDKLKGIEPEVSRALVRETAKRMRAIITETGGVAKPLLTGYRTKIVDGNHLRRTDRRIGELRELHAAPLPGHALVVFDPQYRLVEDVLPCEDGHAQERSLFPQLLDTVEAKDLWIADRNFCTIGFLFGIASRRGKFVIRQHGSLPYVLKGHRKRIGTMETGVVYEQAMEVTADDGSTHVFRRLTVVLNEPTRDGDREVHIVSNLPKRVEAIRIAELYRDRWQIETAFQEVAAALEGEINTLGYPRAALFGFCMALVTYNLLSVVRAAFQAVHGEEEAAQLSTYYLANEVSRINDGMCVILDSDFWRQEFAGLTPKQMAKELKRLAGNVNLKRYKKAHWAAKKKKERKTHTGPPNHVSTFRVLQEARELAAQVASDS